MPRLFVNSMSNFMIQGGVVGFTLQDIRLRGNGTDRTPAEPEDVADVIMREVDFAKLLQFLNQHVAAFEQQVGRPLGGQMNQDALAQAASEGPMPGAAKPTPGE